MTLKTSKSGTTEGAVSLIPKSVANTKVGPSICPIRKSSIVDSTSRRKSQDSVFCDGECNTWLHRGCAGLSKSCFETVSSSKDPFYCQKCTIYFLVKEVASLKTTVEKTSLIGIIFRQSFTRFFVI